MFRRSDEEERFHGGLGLARLKKIDWDHRDLARLSDPARLIYACYVDGCSTEAKETLAAVDLVWRNRFTYRDRAGTSPDRREALDEICVAVEELLARGLLLLVDRSSILGGWVRRPWEGPPS
jgi:hypothetical protein